MSDAPEETTSDGLRLRLAAALRPLITMTVARELDDDALADAADAVERVSATLSARAGGRRSRREPDVSHPAQEFFPNSPVMGLLNPLAPPVRVRVVDGVDGGPREIRAEVYFDDAYEGPPTCVHGGVIAETFDEVLGAANIVAGSPAMTGTLTVRYRRPTPLHAPLAIEARCTGREGRKVHTWGGIYHGDVLTAEAVGLFIEVGPERFVAIAEGNADRADPGTLASIRAEATQADAASDVHGVVPEDAGPDERH